MKVLVSHPTGNTFVRALLESLLKIGALHSYHTTIAFSEKNLKYCYFTKIFGVSVQKRLYNIPSEYIKCTYTRETLRHFSDNIKIPILQNILNIWFGIDRVYSEQDKLVSKKLYKYHITHVHSYEDCSYDTFLEAKNRGVYCSYELPIAYWRKLHSILGAEAEKLPEWKPTLQYNSDSQEKLNRKDLEISLADQVVVPSLFVKDSLPVEVLENKKIVVAPFGTPTINNDIVPVKPNHKPIRFLFAGTMGQRKGLANVLEAFDKINRVDVELVVLGTPLLPMKFYRNIFSNFIYEKPRAHSEVLLLMQSCHVLLLPSIVEGRALVQQEAMSQGLALLITKNTGGEDLVIDGITGFLVPPSNTEELINKIHYFADNPDLTIEMGIQARKHVARFTWLNYTKAIIDSLN